MGKKTHVWEVKIKNENGQLVCISRVTMSVLERAIEY
jgi:1,4-dihydroxy-2-naphthoyl-CoA hydrolase